MNSLRSRLGLGLVLSLALMMGMLWLMAGISVQHLMETHLASRLAHDGESLLGGLDFSTGNKVVMDSRRVQGIYQQPYSGHYFVIESGEQTLRSRSLWDETLGMTPLVQGETRQWRVAGPSQQPLLVWAGGFQK